MDSDSLSFFATAPKGIESTLAQELKYLGASQIRKTTAGVSFEGDLRLGYRACLWLRTANRVFLPIHSFEIENEDDLYDGVREIDWNTHLAPEGTFAVDFSAARSCISHSHYGALKTKDAVVDRFRDIFGVRPSIELRTPDIRVNVRVNQNKVIVSLDLSGESLHKRGYRTEGGAAPLKENLAAAILIKAGWPDIAKSGGALIDPMCGSGTFSIEAAMIAADMAPGLMRDYFGFMKWRQHRDDIWQSLLDEAEEKESKTMGEIVPIFGYDQAKSAIKDSLLNAEKAGMSGLIQFQTKSLSELRPPDNGDISPGLLVINPPYGERLGQRKELRELYRQLGVKLRKEFAGWNVAVLTGNKEVSKQIGVKPERIDQLYNGSIPCDLLRYKFSQPKKRAITDRDSRPMVAIETKHHLASEHTVMFVNRLKKNIKKLESWRRENHISCYRVYDRDIPEYAVAIDVYDQWLHVQEYKAPHSVSPQIAEARLKDVLSVLPGILNVPVGNIFLKQRSQQKSRSQYEKSGSSASTFWVRESGLQFRINLDSYIDTGLFLDHRMTREFIEGQSKGKRFLNLFSYTGTASVYAARGGAISTTSVDKSNTYTDWAKRNMERNSFDMSRHIFHSSDCVKWLENEKGKFDLIFLDPPTFSNTKKTGQRFDIQSDHPSLLRKTVRRLEPNGLLIFSNNYQGFKMNFDQLKDLSIENITPSTIPPDFKRNTKIHNVWLIRHK